MTVVRITILAILLGSALTVHASAGDAAFPEMSETELKGVVVGRLPAQWRTPVGQLAVLDRLTGDQLKQLRALPEQQLMGFILTLLTQTPGAEGFAESQLLADVDASHLCFALNVVGTEERWGHQMNVDRTLEAVARKYSGGPVEGCARRALQDSQARRAAKQAEAPVESDDQL